ncbi:glycosyltransferase family 2 protein [Microbacterium sp. cf332]|uniref:glycosyltransferase family 2 protein n=1 Tax=Microbacterium sp. cf332 TaxID=1761804 RepID=UPI0008809B1C|nr:glycosyltransferase family A protein [Microbacterium sp. cf332]SDQ95256.1 Glycosyltransferase, GT2 family [Microbacterium sp. cf332]
MVDISVVIPCYNGATTLGRQLDALLTQVSRYSFEILISDNRSTDTSAAVIRSYADHDSRIRYVGAFGSQGINHARNAGVRESSGKWLLLCDTDDVVEEGWIEAYGNAFSRGAELLGGPLTHVIGGKTAYEQNRFIDSPWIYQWPYGANCGFTRVAYDRVHGFDESYRGGGDETDFFWRAQIAGMKLEWVPAARIAYYSRDSAHDTFRQKYAYGLSEVKLFLKFREFGMRRQSFTRAPIAAMAAAALYVLRPSTRRLQAGRLGRNLGRIVGSFRAGVVYF